MWQKIFLIIFIIYFSIATYGSIRTYYDKHEPEFKPKATNKTTGFYSGADLVFLSETGTDADRVRIDGYIMGVSEAIVDIAWCQTQPLSYNDINLIVSNYVYSNSNRWHLSAKSLIYESLTTAHPCK